MSLVHKACERKRMVVYSLGIAMGLTILSYIFNNMSVFTGENLTQYAWMELIKSKISSSKHADTIQPLYINVSHDKQLIDINDEYDMYVMGNEVITDRQKLLALLKWLHATDQYKYIFLDIIFEQGYNTDIDSILYAEICSMDRIVVANHKDVELSNDILNKKAAINDYSATITTGFVRYKYSYQGMPSMPLFAYKELTGKTIDRHGLLYICNGNVCYNSLFLHFPVQSFEDEYESYNKFYYNLGSEILTVYDKASFATLTKGKYIVIGDFKNDVHDTYTGEMPGPVITFYAFRALMEGKHMLSYGVVLILFIAYFCLSMFLFCRQSWIKLIPCVRRSKAVYFFLSLIGYGTVLTILSIALDIFAGVATSIILPSTCFAIQSLIINYKTTI